MADDPTRELIERLTRIETKLDHAISATDDHERRIRVLERARWPLPSVLAIVATLSVALSVYAIMRG